MSAATTFAWAAVSPTGRIVPMGVRSCRRDIIELIPQMGMGAGDYDRLGPKRAYRNCYRRGWRCIRVKVTPAFVRQP